MKFRELKANEIDARINTVGQKGASLLLYKDARIDMTLLDETAGSMYWKREHTRDNANCIVSIWNKDIKEWISKEDTGKESYSEQEKGLASDSFKRACVNWGIGRELYTSPFIFVNVETEYVKNEKTGKSSWQLKDRFIKFVVDSIEYDSDRNITGLVIKDSKGGIWFNYGKNTPKKEQAKKENKLPEMTIEQAETRILDYLSLCTDSQKFKSFLNDKEVKERMEAIKMLDSVVYERIKGFIAKANSKFKEGK